MMKEGEGIHVAICKNGCIELDLVNHKILSGARFLLELECHDMPSGRIS